MKKEYSLGEEFVKEVLPRIDTFEKFKTFIEERGEKYNEQTKEGWVFDEVSFHAEYLKDGRRGTSSLGIDFCSWSFDTKKFGFAQDSFSIQSGKPYAVYGSSFANSVWNFNGTWSDDYVCLTSFVSKGNYLQNIMNIKTGLSESSLSRTEALKKLQAKEKEKEMANTETKTLTLEVVKNFFDKFKTRQDFITYVKENNLEYNEETKTGWNLSDKIISRYYKNGILETSPEFVVNSVSFAAPSGNIRFAEVIGPARANQPITCVTTDEYHGHVYGFKDIVTYGITCFDRSEKYYDKTFTKNSESDSHEKFVKKLAEEEKNKDKENKGEELKKSNLGIDWIKTIYPNVSTHEKFKNYIKEIGEEYNEETKTGWKLESDSRKIWFYKNGTVNMSPKLNITDICFKENGNFDFVEISSVDYFVDDIVPRNIVAVDNRPGIFSICIADYVYIPNKKEYQYFEVETGKSFRSKTRVNEKSVFKTQKYELGEKFVDEVMPKIDTLEKFRNFIKENQVEYNEETKTGWKEYQSFPCSMFHYYENGKNETSNIGASRISFFSQKEKNENLRFIENSNSIKNQPETIVTKHYFKEQQHSHAKYFSETDELIFYYDYKRGRYNPKTKILIVKDSIAELAKSFSEETKKEENKPITEVQSVKLDDEWIEKILPQIDTFEKFKTFIEKEKTSWNVLPGTYQCEFTNKEKNSDLLGVAHVYFNSEGNLRFAQRRNSVFSESEVDKDILHAVIAPPEVGIKNDRFLVKQTLKPFAHSYSNILYDKKIKKDVKHSKKDYYNFFKEELEEFEKNQKEKENNVSEKEVRVKELIVEDIKDIPAIYQGPAIIKNRNGLKVEVIPSNNITSSTNGVIVGEFRTLQYIKNGKHHREDGPAIEYKNGTKEWWVEGKRHRIDGPAIEESDGTKYWHKEGNLHREDGPAIEESDGTKYWHKEGNLHREDGPAIEYADGIKRWFIEGKELTQKEIEDFEFKLASPKLAKVKLIVESDAREVAKRIAANQIARFIQNILVASIKTNPSKTKRLKEFLESEHGKAAIKLIASGAIPVLKQHLSSKYGDVLDELSEEFRIQGETDIATSIVDKVLEAISSKTINQFETATNLIRVDVESTTKPEEQSESFEEYYSSTTFAINEN
ncbi:MAG TPA: hypothetical protein PLP33_19650 [Leptospiraceae bacterium]|nr:hypothetical protein [Leptospiraceae bacterium]